MYLVSNLNCNIYLFNYNNLLIYLTIHNDEGIHIIMALFLFSVKNLPFALKFSIIKNVVLFMFYGVIYLY